MITKEQLAADKALCEKATEGPWEGHTEKDGPCVWSTIRAGRKWVTQAGGFTRTRGGESEEHYGVVMSADDLAFATRARTALPEYIAKLETMRERIEQVEQVDLAGYLHNHGLPCTVEALATRRLFLDVLRGTEQGKAPSELEALRARHETLLTLAEKIIDTESHSGRPFSDDRLVPGGPIRELRAFMRVAKCKTT